MYYIEMCYSLRTWLDALMYLLENEHFSFTIRKINIITQVVCFWFDAKYAKNCDEHFSNRFNAYQGANSCNSLTLN